jgi:hypothetical protein
MTLHVAIVTPVFVVQVGDRLLTIDTPDGKAPWPKGPYANKTIVVDAADGILIVSFAGLAHIKKMPTDYWLTSVISGLPPAPPMRPGGGSPTSVTQINLTVAGVCASIKSSIESDFVAEPYNLRKAGLEVLITGWTWDPALTEFATFVYGLSHSGELGAPCEDMYGPSFPFQNPPSGKGQVLAIGYKTAVATNRVASVMNRGGARKDDTAFEAMLAGIIRDMAAQPGGTVIGTELIATCLSPLGTIRSRFLRDLSLAQPNVAYTPAYICGGAVIYPQVVVGNGFTFGRLEIECVPPLPPPADVLAASSSVPPVTP